jgi:hypothetical protein
VSDTFSAFDQRIDENLGEFPNIDITGTGALTCDVIDEDLETTMGLSDSTASQNFAYSFSNFLSELFGFVAETKLFWKFVAMAAFWKLRLANFNSLIERLSNAR